jgi:hypothetical protein
MSVIVYPHPMIEGVRYMIDAQDLLCQLVAIDSRNPALVPGGPGETAIADDATRQDEEAYA